MNYILPHSLNNSSAISTPERSFLDDINLNIHDMANYLLSYKGGKVYISHLENEELAKNISQSILSEYQDANVSYYEMRGLCAYYCEKGGIVIGLETK